MDGDEARRSATEGEGWRRSATEATEAMELTKVKKG
jgi:hypothetical protein